MTNRSSATVKRMTLRVITRELLSSSVAQIVEIREQEIPATLHEIGLFLRRAPFREAIAEAMLKGHSITIERKEVR